MAAKKKTGKRRGRPPKPRTIDDLDKEERASQGDMASLYTDEAEAMDEIAHSAYEDEQVMRDMGLDPFGNFDR